MILFIYINSYISIAIPSNIVIISYKQIQNHIIFCKLWKRNTNTSSASSVHDNIQETTSKQTIHHSRRLVILRTPRKTSRSCLKLHIEACKAEVILPPTLASRMKSELRKKGWFICRWSRATYPNSLSIAGRSTDGQTHARAIWSEPSSNMSYSIPIPASLCCKERGTMRTNSRQDRSYQRSDE